MEGNPDKEDPNFNPMRIEDFKDLDYCKRKGAERLYTLANSNFRQQNMAAIRPIPTVCYSVSIFIIIIILCLSFGITTISNLQ
jgi:hypothetical protein